MDEPGRAPLEEPDEPLDPLDEALTETFPASDPIAVFDRMVRPVREADAAPS
jgi:hypothetical protein